MVWAEEKERKKRWNGKRKRDYLNLKTD